MTNRENIQIMQAGYPADHGNTVDRVISVKGTVRIDNRHYRVFLHSHEGPCVWIDQPITANTKTGN